MTACSKLVDRFGTLAPIGEGAMGLVLEGYDAERQCPVAIKMLKVRDPDARRRMLREAELLARVQHPNVCAILELGESDGQPWIMMPLIRGRVLDQAWQSLSLDARIDLLIDVCRGVEAAHAAGLIHRDLKPANIMVTSDEHGALVPIVMDFGIARNEYDPAGSLTATGEIVGTPNCMSPEQVRGERSLIDRRTDVWAIGCLLYQAICDRLPYLGASAAVVMAQIVTRDVPSPRRLRPQLSRKLARICVQCLERDRGRRYPDVSSIREDLRRYRKGLPVLARETGVGFALRRSFKHNPAAWGIGAVLTLGLVLVLAGWLQARLEAGRREALARQLSASAEIIRSRMQIAHLAPLHDLRPERAQLARLTGQADAHLTDPSAGIAALARRSIGLSALALGDHAKVIDTLTPLVGTWADDGDLKALATAHLQRYQLAAEAVADLPELERNGALSAAREQDLQPARSYLASLQTPDGSMQARLLLIDGDLDGARRAVAALNPEPISEVTSAMLAGDLAMAEAADRASRGEREAAQHLYVQARQQFALAADTARSDSQVLRRVCDAALGGYRQRLAVAELAPTGPLALDANCFAALVADPGDPVVHETLAGVWEAIAHTHDLRNEREAMDAALRAAIQHADLAVGSAPDLLGARLFGARARQLQAGHLADDLQAGRQHYDAAIALLEPLLAKAPGFAAAHLLQGRLLAARVRLLNNHGQNESAQSYAPALVELREAYRLRPQDPETLDALSLTLVFQFYVLRNQDLAAATAVMHEAIGVLDAALVKAPDDPDMLFGQGANLGDLWAAEANWATAEGAFDAATLNLDRSLELLARLRRVAPQRMDGFAQPIAELATFGELARARHLPRLARLEQAQALAAEASSAGVKLDQSLLAWVSLEQAIALDEIGDAGAAAAFATADRHLRAAEQDPEELYSATRQRLEWVVARLAWVLRNHGPVTATAAQGDATLKALLNHPRGGNDGIVHCNAGAFHWLLGQQHITANGLAPGERVRLARAAFDRCQQLSPSYAKRWTAAAAAAAAGTPVD